MCHINILCAHPIVSSLVFVIDPVEGFYSAILDAVFSNPLIGITPALGEDARHHPHLLQVDLDPLILVVKLGEPRTPNKSKQMPRLWRIHYYDKKN